MLSKGYAAYKAGEELKPYEFERRVSGADDVELDILYSGICHSDIHTVRGEWGDALFPVVPGHEICGVVTAVGSNVSKFKVGEKIGVGVYIDSCKICPSCLSDNSNYCDEGMTGTFNALERDGVTKTYGGYSESFVVNEKFAVKIPDNLDMAAVAPLMCAGITLYSPLKHWDVKKGSKVGIIGLGGLGHMGVKFAHAMGADVTVFSHSPNKKDDALKLGANHFINTSEPNFADKLNNQFDLIINTVSAFMSLDPYLDMLKIDSTLVVIGLPGKPYEVHAHQLLQKRRAIAGSMIGDKKELQEMLDFCGKHNIVSEIELITPVQINAAYNRAVNSDVKYRFVIDASKFKTI